MWDRDSDRDFTFLGLMPRQSCVSSDVLELDGRLSNQSVAYKCKRLRIYSPGKPLLSVVSG